MKPWRGLDSVGSVLCLGAHCDDAEIGCGGLLQHLNPGTRLDAIVFSGNPERAEESRRAMEALAGHTELSVSVLGYADGRFPSAWQSIKDEMERLKLEVQPDLVITHHREDKHQDHRIVAELTWNTWRNHPILEYEILKFDDDLKTPNVYLPLTEEQAVRKARTLVAEFRSQADKPWMSEDVFLGLMRVRGVQIQERYAEGFYAPKLRL